VQQRPISASSGENFSALTNTLLAPAATTHNNQWSFGLNPAGQIASTTRSPLPITVTVHLIDITQRA